MFKNINKNSISTILIACFMAMILLTPTNSYAIWEDKSDELPGMDNNLKLVLIVGGALIATLIVVKVVKSGNKKNVKSEQPKKETEADSTATSFIDKKFQNNFKLNYKNYLESTPYKNELSIKPYLGLEKNPNIDLANRISPKTSNDHVFVVGLTIDF